MIYTLMNDLMVLQNEKSFIINGVPSKTSTEKLYVTLDILIILLDWGCIYCTWVTAFYDVEARRLRIYDSPWKHSLVIVWVHFEFGRNFLLRETASVWPVSYSLTPIHLMTSSCPLAPRLHANKVPQSLAHCHASVACWATRTHYD